MRRFHLMQRVLTQMGIEPGRTKLLWASAAEGQIFANEVTKFVEEVRALGPLNWNTTSADIPAEVPAQEVQA
jgi:coenzyme F420-reducing hydrogenase delta subunit